MKRFDKDVDIDEKIIELKLAMKNTNNIRLYKRYSVVLKHLLIMILDNSRIHHAKLIQPFLMKVKDRLELMFLPSYSPELNLIEGLWGWIKSSIINNKFFSSVAIVKTAINKFIDEINKAPHITIDRLFIKM